MQKYYILLVNFNIKSKPFDSEREAFLEGLKLSKIAQKNGFKWSFKIIKDGDFNI